MNAGSKLDLNTSYAWIDEVFYSPFEADTERADAYGRLDLRASWTSSDTKLIVSGFVNNVLDDIGVLQVLRQGEDEFFRHNTGTTLPRAYGLEVTVNFGGN